MPRILNLQRMHADGIDSSAKGDPDSGCSWIACNTLSTCSESSCSNPPPPSTMEL